jgi:lysozyme
MLTLSPTGLALIQSFEGLRLRAYRDATGIPTIGYGSTRGVRLGMVITPEQATARLREDVADAEAAVRRLVTVPITQGQFDALVSFTYNLGAGNLAKSTLLELLNLADYAGAANQFPRWIKAGGKNLRGLVRRRAAERALFLGDRLP